MVEAAAGSEAEAGASGVEAAEGVTSAAAEVLVAVAVAVDGKARFNAYVFFDNHATRASCSRCQYAKCRPRSLEVLR